MKRIACAAATAFMAVFTMLPALAQDIDLEAANLPADEFVPTITEDHDGNVWIGTREGLVRYGNGETKVFSHDSTDATSLAFDYIEELYVDSEGSLWVGTYGGGLDRFVPESETFVHHRPDPNDPTSLSQENVTVILEDSDGVLWVGTRDGLNRMHEDGTFTRYQQDENDPSSLQDSWLRALLEDSQGRFWIGTQGGLLLFNREHGTSVAYTHSEDDVSSLIDDRISTLLEDNRGRLWVGSGRPEGGLNLFDPALGSVRRYAYDPDDPTWLTKASPDGPFDLGGVTTVMQDSDGVIWVGSWEGWVTGYNPDTGESVNYDFRTLDPGTTDEIRIFDIFEASDGTLWFGSVYGPLYRGTK